MKSKQKFLSAMLELRESGHSAGSCSDFPVQAMPFSFFLTRAKHWVQMQRTEAKLLLLWG